MAEEDSLEFVVGGFRDCECGGEGEEIVVGLETGFFKRGFQEVWARLGLVGGFIVGVFLVCVILVYDILTGAYEILLYGIKIRVASEETEWSNSINVIFCEIRILKGNEAVFFVVGLIEADFGKIVIVFEEEKCEY